MATLPATHSQRALEAAVVMCNTVFHAPGTTLHEPQQDSKKEEENQMRLLALIDAQIQSEKNGRGEEEVHGFTPSSIPDINSNTGVGVDADSDASKTSVSSTGDANATISAAKTDDETPDAPTSVSRTSHASHHVPDDSKNVSNDTAESRSASSVGGGGSSLLKAVRNVQKHREDQGQGVFSSNSGTTEQPDSAYSSSNQLIAKRSNRREHSRASSESYGRKNQLDPDVAQIPDVTAQSTTTSTSSSAADAHMYPPTLISHSNSQVNTYSRSEKVQRSKYMAETESHSHLSSSTSNLLGAVTATATRSQTTMSQSEAVQNRKRTERRVRDKFESVRAELEALIAKKGGPKQCISVVEDVKLYALAMQATQGDVRGLKPGVFDGISRKRYSAWKKLRGTPQRWAQEDYIVTAMTIMGRIRLSDTDSSPGPAGQTRGRGMQQQKQRRLPHRRSVTPNSFVRPSRSASIHGDAGIASDGEGDDDASTSTSATSPSAPSAASAPSAIGKAKAAAVSVDIVEHGEKFYCLNTLKKLVEFFDRAIDDIGPRTGHLSPYDSERVMTMLQDLVNQQIRAAELIERGSSTRGVTSPSTTQLRKQSEGLISLRMIAMYLDGQGSKVSKILREEGIHVTISRVMLDFIVFLAEYKPQRYISEAQNAVMTFEPPPEDDNDTSEATDTDDLDAMSGTRRVSFQQQPDIGRSRSRAIAHQ